MGDVFAWAGRHRYTPSRPSTLLNSQASMKHAGIVNTQAMTIWPATPQRTADSRRVEPTPRMAELMVCVVDTGTPNRLAASITVAAAVSAAKP